MPNYTEMCCRSGGSNLNAGSRDGGNTEPSTTPDFEYISGSWDSSTYEFTVASGNPLTDGVLAGDFASIYPDGSSATSYIGRVTSVTSTKIIISATIFMGTIPTTGVNNTTLRIGGAWLGPNGSGFPFTLAIANLVNSSSYMMRINFKNDRTHSITSEALWSDGALGATRSFPCTFEGYTSTYGDGGVATIEGSSSGASYRLLYIQRGRQVLKNLWFNRNGSTGSASLVRIESVSDSIGGLVEGCIFTNSRGSGLEVRSSGCRIVNCIANSNNSSNTVYLGGFIVFVVATFLRCVAKNNTRSGYVGGAGSNSEFIDCISIGSSVGFDQDNSGGNRGSYYNCIAYESSTGFVCNSAEMLHYSENCIAYRGTSAGTAFSVVTGGLTTIGYVELRNCAVGNMGRGTSGEFVNDKDPIELTANPFLDPSNGDFRLNDEEGGGKLLKESAYQDWLQTPQGALGSVSYADIGIAQILKTKPEYKYYRKKKR